jgi:hypothetical protein
LGEISLPDKYTDIGRKSQRFFEKEQRKSRLWRMAAQQTAGFMSK